MIRKTTLLEPILLARQFGQKIHIASETFQHTGSFKFRAAWNVVSNASNEHMIATSSGNFGQALAFASEVVGKRCTIVMPDDSANVKIEAVRSYGAEVDLIDVRQISRAKRLEQLAQQFPEAYFTNAYDDDLIIAGNSTLGRELAEVEDIDTVVVPIGGGGLSSGIVKGLRAAGIVVGAGMSGASRRIDVVGAEPALGDKVTRSLKSGQRVIQDHEPRTIADGARTLSLGERNWAILKDGLAGVVAVSEQHIADAVRLLFYKANLKVEPTGALAIAVLLADPDRFRDRKVCCVVTGGNVDGTVYAKYI